MVKTVELISYTRFFRTSPEVVLMKSIRGSARQLQDKLAAMREKGNKVR